MVTKEQIKRETPFGVAIIAILVALLGLVYILLGISSFGICSGGVNLTVGKALLNKAITGLIYIFLGLFSLVLSRGLWRLENWAWWSAILVEAFAALTSLSDMNLLMLVVSLIVILYLISKRYLFIF